MPARWIALQFYVWAHLDLQDCAWQTQGPAIGAAARREHYPLEQPHKEIFESGARAGSPSTLV
jgi:hypothetical protein